MISHSDSSTDAFGTHVQYRFWYTEAIPPSSGCSWKIITSGHCSLTKTPTGPLLNTPLFPPRYCFYLFPNLLCFQLPTYQVGDFRFEIRLWWDFPRFNAEDATIIATFSKCFLCTRHSVKLSIHILPLPPGNNTSKKELYSILWMRMLRHRAKVIHMLSNRLDIWTQAWLS